MGIAPAVLGVVVVVGSTVAVGLLDFFLDAFLVFRLDKGVGLGQLTPPLHRSIDEDAQHVLALPQHIVAAAAKDHAGAFLSQLLDDTALQNEHLIAQRQLVAHGVQAVQQAVGVALFTGRHRLFGQAGMLGCHGDQLLVVKLDAQCICHILCDEASAGAVLTAQSDDRLCHNVFLLFHISP